MGTRAFWSLLLGNERADRQATNAQLLPVAERVPLELQAFMKKELQFSHHLTIDHAYFDSFQFTNFQLASISKHQSTYFPLICRLISNHSRFRYHWLPQLTPMKTPVPSVKLPAQPQCISSLSADIPELNKPD
jgi:hypothetical protein